MNKPLVPNEQCLEMIKLGFIKSVRGKYPDMERFGKQAGSKKKTHFVKELVYRAYLKYKCPDKSDEWIDSYMGIETKKKNIK